MPVQTVIFACVHNAGRSQIARAFFAAFADPARAKAISAGTEPGDHVHPVVIEALSEVGIDVSDQRPQRLTPELAASAALIVTMGCGESCPVVPGVEVIDWPTPDPKGQDLDSVRMIRELLKKRVQMLVRVRGWSGRDDPARR